MRLEDATVLEHTGMQGGYRLLVVNAPGIAPEVQPGQFVHLLVSHQPELTLRRPFSVYQAEKGGRLAILYKEVGKGTHAMKTLAPGERVDLLGPLGRGFPACDADAHPVLVAGGYGMAALYLVAATASREGTAFVGGAAKQDILCVEEFTALGWDVRVATEDGSQGTHGLVTDALDAWVETEMGTRQPELYACGPNAMLKAVGERAQKGGWKAWLSADRNMGCGVGACLTCVQKVRGANGQWAWARVCREGPVFECRDIIWDEDEENG